MMLLEKHWNSILLTSSGLLQHQWNARSNRLFVQIVQVFIFNHKSKVQEADKGDS